MNQERSLIPPSWDYNPSAWGQRVFIVSLATLALVISIYLSLWQYRVVEDVWEPFFGEGAELILDSELSWILPFGISDAALGAAAYLADAVAGLVGGRNRWRTMPWIVVVFAILIGPVGFVSVGLVIAQPVFYQAWCTLCISTAVLSILMIGPAMDEALATLQHLRRVQRTPGRSAWRALWGRDDAISPDELSRALPRPEIRDAGLIERWNLPLAQMFLWPQGLVALLGIWLIVAPGLLPIADVAATSDRTVGPLIAALGVISMWEVTRHLRWVNVALGAWLILAPLFLGFPGLEAFHGIVIGALVIVLASVRGALPSRFGGGWSSLWRERSSIHA